MREDKRMLVRPGPLRPAYPGGGDGAPAFDPVLPPPPAGTGLRDLGQVLKRRSRLILLTMVVLNVVAIVAMHSVRPRYFAEASVIIGPRQVQVVDLKGVLAGLTGESDVIESQIEVLRSRRIARAVIERLHLDRAADLNPALAEPPGAVGQAVGAIGARISERWRAVLAILPGWLRTAIVGAKPPAPSPRETADSLTPEVDNFLKRLTVVPKGHSRVVAIGFESSDPEQAATIANAVADTYIADQLQEKLDATAHARKWLDERVSELREQVISADQAVEAYRQRAGITQGRVGSLLSEQMSSLGEQVVQARAALAGTEAKLEAVRAGMAVGHGAALLPDTLASLTLQTLRGQESAARARAADYARTLGERNPRTISARAEAEAVTSDIRAELGRMYGVVRQDAEAARARVASLTESLQEARKGVQLDNASEVELHALQREAEANRALYDRLLTRSRETSVEGGLQQPDAQVISHAEAPNAPSYPNPMIILPLVLVVSSLATGLLVFVVEGLDHGFTSLEQVEQVLGVAALGLVPALKRGIGRLPAVASYVLDRPQSAYGEAIRSLHTSLMLSNTERPPRVVLVASALPGEGKTSLILSLARLMATCGKRVVVVDCDLRRPDLHKAFGATESPGLVDCLYDRAGVFDVLRHDTASPAYLVPAGSQAHTPPDLLGSEAMRGLVKTLAERFDLVLLDSAPVLAVSDTRNLCRLADKVVFVVRWQSTRRFAALPALRQLFEAGGDLAGVMLSMVDLNGYTKHSMAGIHHRQISYYLND